MNRRLIAGIIGWGLTLLGLAGAQPGKPELWFPVGERLTYNVSWGPWDVGTVWLSSEWVEEEGRDLIAIRVKTRSNGFLDAIYPVDDFLESVIDPETFTPLRFTKRLNEGKRHLNEITYFEHELGVAEWRQVSRNQRRQFAIEPDSRDLLSFMFYMRSQRFTPGAVYHFKVMADDKLHAMDVYARAVVPVKLPDFGTARCLKVDPEAKFQGLFVRVGRIQVWISDDDRYLCAKATAKVPVGSVRMVLTRVEGPGNDHWLHPERLRAPQARMEVKEATHEE